MSDPKKSWSSEGGRAQECLHPVIARLIIAVLEKSGLRGTYEEDAWDTPHMFRWTEPADHPRPIEVEVWHAVPDLSSGSMMNEGNFLCVGFWGVANFFLEEQGSWKFDAHTHEQELPEFAELVQKTHEGKGSWTTADLLEFIRAFLVIRAAQPAA